MHQPRGLITEYIYTCIWDGDGSHFDTHTIQNQKMYHYQKVAIRSDVSVDRGDVFSNPSSYISRKALYNVSFTTVIQITKLRDFMISTQP